MKNTINWKVWGKFPVISAIILLISILSPGIITQKASAHEVVSFQVFYDRLSPYGDWISTPQYGYAWVPNVAVGFTPYGSDGHWEYTEFGWSWVSNYPWGWAPFHYGRWAFDSMYGWIWIPDTEWGPAWVVWRQSPGYYGWAPMPPGVSVSIGFSVGIPYERWYFVRERDFWRPHINHYFVSRTRASGIYRNSVIIQNTMHDRGRNATYIAGPNRNDVQRATGRSVRALMVSDYSKPGQVIRGNKMEIYRPEVQRSVGGAAPAPSKVTDNRNITPLYDRIDKSQKRSVAPQQEGQNNAAVPRSARSRYYNNSSQGSNNSGSQARTQQAPGNQRTAPSIGRGERVQGNRNAAPGTYSQPRKQSLPPVSQGRGGGRHGQPQSVGRSQPSGQHHDAPESRRGRR